MLVLHTITKDKMVTSATDLIHKLEKLKEEANKEAIKLGYNSSNYIFNPKCYWEEIEDNQIKLIFKLEIKEI